jgi:hypothetical protein
MTRRVTSVRSLGKGLLHSRCRARGRGRERTDEERESGKVSTWHLWGHPERGAELKQSRFSCSANLQPAAPASALLPEALPPDAATKRRCDENQSRA